MKKLILREILAPLSRRMGTMIASFLVGTAAFDPALVDQFVVALGAVTMVGFDLVVSHFDRKAGR